MNILQLSLCCDKIKCFYNNALRPWPFRTDNSWDYRREKRKIDFMPISMGLWNKKKQMTKEIVENHWDFRF